MESGQTYVIRFTQEMFDQHEITEEVLFLDGALVTLLEHRRYDMWRVRLRELRNNKNLDNWRIGRTFLLSPRYLTERELPQETL